MKEKTNLTVDNLRGHLVLGDHQVVGDGGQVAAQSLGVHGGHGDLVVGGCFIFQSGSPPLTRRAAVD